MNQNNFPNINTSSRWSKWISTKEIQAILQTFPNSIDLITNRVEANERTETQHQLIPFQRFI